MLKHKHIDMICYIIVALTLIITLLFMNRAFGVTSAVPAIGYENKLFDPASVHSIEIVMDDWDGFLSTCTSEEYSPCTIIIDGEKYTNIGIRGKGNTSLSNVAAYGNDRYSFKVEFDKYVDGSSYHGLDKLCLNNIIQDNTYLKEYMTYAMMNAMDVTAPLCSFAYITVNGDDWGLYSAVEGVEEGFLQRNYGTNYGELYKPDSMQMGGGRGNGREFNMSDIFGDLESADNSDNDRQISADNFSPPEQKGEVPEDFDPTEFFGSSKAPIMPQDDADTGKGPNMGGGMDRQDGEGPNMGGGMDRQDGEGPNMGGGMGRQDGEGPNMGGGMGSQDVMLQYIDDDPDSYSNIFDNAKTDVTKADQKRLIKSLKTLSEGEDIESVVDVEAVIKYLVVHDFVCNGDSYTGSMIHNYYLYEEDGLLSMIPWDYNLAFGGFGMGGGKGGGSGSSGASSEVNSPIDSPVSGGTLESRPMISWIFENEEYTNLYHQYYAEFISDYFDSGTFEQIFDEAVALISPYVEKDPTAFCSYEEYETGAATLREFCLLRAESVSGQLQGRIPATDEGQEADSSSLVDASHLSIAAMGQMNTGNRGCDNRQGTDSNDPVFPENNGNNKTDEVK